MTSERSIELVESAFDAWEEQCSVGDAWSEEHEAKDMAIKALKQKGQEPILDKIRDEIEDMDAPNCDFEGFYKCQSEVLQIIDKYKVESEG